MAVSSDPAIASRDPPVPASPGIGRAVSDFLGKTDANPGRLPCCRSLKAGEELIARAAGEGELRLLTKDRAIKEAQAIVARYLPKGRDLVQELIDERRAEAARE